MNRWVERVPLLVFRVAVAVVALVSIGAVLVLLGMLWHDAARWVLKLSIPAVLVVAAGWVIGTLKDH